MTESSGDQPGAVPDANGAIVTAPTQPPPDSPYKGLIPYNEADSAFFFGRDGERQLIAANLLASRLTVLYGESGAGKTSVLRAGVVHDLRNRALRAVAAGRAPEAIVVEFATWRGEPIAGLAQAIESSVRIVYGDATPVAPPTDNLVQLLRDWSDRLDVDLLLILDQFEEYFLYHPDDSGPRSFAAQFPAAVVDRTVRANFLLAIREDALWKLDGFDASIASQINNRLRLDHLDRDSARAAILQPVEEYDRRSGQPPHTIEPALVELVLDQVRRVPVAIRPTEQEASADAPAAVGSRSSVRIETPFLQLVMSRLWTEEAAANSRVMRLATLDRLGNAQEIVQTHLDDAMAALAPSRRDVAARVFQYLVTSAGAKIALSAEELAGFSNVPSSKIEPVLRELADLPTEGETASRSSQSARILRSVAPPPGSDVIRYEIYHDVLGPAIRDWRGRHNLAAVRIRARRRIRLLAAGIVAAVMVTVVAATIAVGARQAENTARLAEEQARSEKDAAVAAQLQAVQAQADAQSHMVLAISQLGIDPQASVHHALQAWHLLEPITSADKAAADETIRLALSHARLAAVAKNHDDIVWSASFSPDGTKLITASEDKSARIVDAASGTTILTLPLDDVVLDARFTPDGSRVVTVDFGGVVRVWNAETGASIHRLDHNGFYVALAESDGYDATGAYVATGPFTSDSKLLVTAAGLEATVWDLETGKPTMTFEHPEDTDQVKRAAFSGDGKRIVTAADDGTVRIWDVATGALVGEPMDNDTPWTNVATFSPDGTLLATGNSDGSVGIWDAAKGTLVRYRVDHDNEVRAVAFSADGTLLMSAGGSTTAVLDVSKALSDKTATLFDLFDPTSSSVENASFSPDGRYVVTAFDDGTAHVANVETGYEVAVLRGHGDIVWTARFSRDGRRIVTASDDHTARVWRFETSERSVEQTKSVTAVAFSPDGKLAATASFDQTIKLFRVDNDAPPSLLEGEDAEVGYFDFRSVEFNDDGSELLTLQSEGTVQRWDVRTKEPKGACCIVDGTLANFAAYVPGRRDVLLIGYEDGIIRFWDVSGGQAGTELETLDPDHSFSTTRLILVSPDGKRILTVGRFDRLARIWDAASLETIGEWDAGSVGVAAFSPDGERLLIGSGTGGARVVDPLTGADLIEKELAGNSAIISAAFSPDGLWIVTGQRDGSTRVWSAATGTLLGELLTQARVINAVAVNEDRLILAGSADGTAKVFSCAMCVEGDEIVALAEAQAAVYEPAMTQPEGHQTGGPASPNPSLPPGPSPSASHEH